MHLKMAAWQQLEDKQLGFIWCISRNHGGSLHSHSPTSRSVVSTCFLVRVYICSPGTSDAALHQSCSSLLFFPVLYSDAVTSAVSDQRWNGDLSSPHISPPPPTLTLLPPYPLSLQLTFGLPSFPHSINRLPIHFLSSSTVCGRLHWWRGENRGGHGREK